MSEPGTYHVGAVVKVMHFGIEWQGTVVHSYPSGAYVVRPDDAPDNLIDVAGYRIIGFGTISVHPS